MDFAISEGRRESRITNPSESVSQERSASQSVSQSVSQLGIPSIRIGGVSFRITLRDVDKRQVARKDLYSSLDVPQA